MNPAPLEAMLARGQDNALLRFSLGSAWLGQGEPARAAEHLARAVEHDPGYSAAWKLLGKALAAAGDAPAARAAYARGIEVATAKGDLQAAKEMQVFLKRLQREPPAP
ncbi:tetratricopeptide repeat protein [Plasticicumulans lactativorans]|uniref:Tetratricopeptide repeat protein n=1 Tax=Plasticicumulans lactativorans TaxID=1133106 RepID=A0A4R2LB28_9GAMM|nr:tetratricopeptide repeat protein [Plasticicumulans lactativorans]TCO81466.1 tetratricopeptide repeat protein [Plasticicumulans lactativorans]